MNYEEMLKAQEGMSPHRESLPFGGFFRRQIDGKFRYVIELRPELTDNIVFCESLKSEQQWLLRQRSNLVLHYEVNEANAQPSEVLLEPGMFQPLSSLLRDNPAVVAQRGFVDQVVESLFDYASQLHSQQLFYLCFAPQNVFVRKGDNAPLVLFHGSFYKNVSDKGSLFAGANEFVAPEVLSGQPFDQRSDVYSLGRLIEYLYSQGSMPFEYKGVVKKATAQNPDKRYKSIDDMRSAIAQKRSMRRSALMMVAAVVISLVAFFAYTELLPSSESIEFVEPAPQTAAVDTLGDQYGSGLDLNDEGDSLDITDEMLNAKAEAIYRKRYEKAADEILSKVYNSKHMGSSEKTFMANSQSMAEELLKAQQQLAEETGMPSGVAGRIGHEIVEKLTEQKQKSLSRHGYIRAGEGDDSDE